jgi:hypothetical protein
MLDIWPVLPLFVLGRAFDRSGAVNIIGLLEHSDRVCQIDLKDVASSQLEKVLAAMQVPFPELTRLLLWSDDETMSVLPDSFLGGSAPLLEYLSLDRIPFPGLPKLLLSATHLVHLRLENIPHSGYIPPEAMATVLSALTSLEKLSLEFQSPRSCPDRASQSPPPPTRAVLSILTEFLFKGVDEYLDDLVARIDAPQLFYLDITLFNQIVFDTPQLVQFICRTPKLKAPQQARFQFEDGAASVELSSPRAFESRTVCVKIPCSVLDWQVSALVQVCTSCLPPLSTVGYLFFYGGPFSQPGWQGNIENTLWLELLHPFSALTYLYLSEESARRIAPALQELVEGGRTTEVLPTLQLFSLQDVSGSVKEGIEPFIAARQVTSHPIEVITGTRSRT